MRVGGPALPLEGEVRPGHFDGVATVVAKLLSQAAPDRAYFGRKDGQQVAVVKRLVHDLDLPVGVVALPQRCGRTTGSRSAAATSISRWSSGRRRLCCTARWRRRGDRFRAGRQRAFDIEAACRRIIEAEPRIDAIDYVAAVDPDTMEPWRGVGECMLATAARLGGVRLIDNVILD